MKKFLLTMAVGLLGLGAANAETYTDVLTSGTDCFNVSGTTYKEVSFTSSISGVVYKGQMAGDKSSIQLRSSNSNSGIVVSENSKNLELVSITVDYNDATNNARVLNIYSSDASLSAPTELYNTSLTKVGTISKSAPEAFVAETNISYWGVRSNSGAMYINKITVVWQDAESGKELSGLSFGETTSFTADLGSTFDAPVLINPNNLPVTYTSSNESVATVAADGKVTLVGDGETTITATSEETDKFYAGKASYTLAVAKIANNVKEFIALGDGSVAKVNFPMTVAFVNYSNIFAVDVEGDFIQIYGANSYKANDVIPAGWVGTYKYYNSTTPEILPVGDLPASTETAEFTPNAVTASAISNDLVNNVILIKNVEFAEATPATKANFEGLSDGTTLSFRNNYTIESVEAGIYDVTVVVAVYQGAPSLYVIAYKEVSELPNAPSITVNGEEYDDGRTITGNDVVTVEFSGLEANQAIYYKLTFKNATRAGEEGYTKLDGSQLKLDNTISALNYYVGDAEGTPITKIAKINVDITTGVESIEAENVVATYYDLNGRVVNGQLEKGIYVKVANGKASKVIVK